MKILNKSQLPENYSIRIEGFSDFTLTGQVSLTVAGGEVATVPLTLAVNPDEVLQRVQEVTFVVQNAAGDVQQKQVTTFIYE